MDDLIRAAPDSALDADNFDAAADLTVGDAEEVSSPSDFPRVSRKRLRGSPHGPCSGPSAKRMKRISDWEGDIDRRRFRPIRSASVQEVGTFSADALPQCFLT